MYRVFYFLYWLIGGVLFLGFWFALVWILDSLVTNPNAPIWLKEIISQANSFAPIPLWMKVAVSIVIPFGLLCVLYHPQKFHDNEMKKYLESLKFQPITSAEYSRLNSSLSKNIFYKESSLRIRAKNYGRVGISISSGAFERCTDEELCAMALHEQGHLIQNDDFTKKLAKQARWAYSFIFKLLRMTMNVFWGAISRCLFTFCTVSGFILLYRSPDMKEQVLGYALLGLLIVVSLFFVISKTVLRKDALDMLTKLEDFLKKISLYTCKWIYRLLSGWILMVGDTLAENEADRYAVTHGYCRQLCTVLNRVAVEEPDRAKELSGRIRWLQKNHIT